MGDPDRDSHRVRERERESQKESERLTRSIVGKRAGEGHLHVASLSIEKSIGGESRVYNQWIRIDIEHR